MNYRDEFRNYERETYWSTGRVIRYFVLLAVVLGVIGFGFNIISQPARIVEKTMDADNVISNYEFFKAQWEAVKASDLQITQAEEAVTTFKTDNGTPKDYTIGQTNELGRLNAILQGLKANRASMVAEYNAKAQMANRSIFMKGVPERLQ